MYLSDFEIFLKQVEVIWHRWEFYSGDLLGMKVEILEQFVEHEDEMKNILEDDEASHKNYLLSESNQE